MRLLRIPKPFDHPDFIFEPKLDGFRALAHVRGHHCELISRNGITFKSWPQLANELAHAVRARDAILDGEICCLDADGRSNFNHLLFRREWPYFYAFDLLRVNGRDLRALPLLERKRELRSIIPRIDTRLLFLDHIETRGRDLFAAACEQDLEGIVGKWARGTYHTEGRQTSWIKVKHPGYSQMRDRHELFTSQGRQHRHAKRAVAAQLVLT